MRTFKNPNVLDCLWEKIELRHLKRFKKVQTFYRFSGNIYLR